MTLPWAAAALLAVSLPAQAGLAAPNASGASARARFLLHRPGEPLVGSAAAQDVELGCDLPCATPAQISAYFRKIELACLEMGLSGADRGWAKANYAPGGVPRKKTAADLRSNSAVPKLKPGLVLKKASDIAAALGRSSFIDADEAAVAAPQAVPRALRTPARRPARALPSAPPLKRAPLEPAAVERNFEDALAAEIVKRPTGKALMSSVVNPPRVTLEILDPDTVAQHGGMGRAEKIAISSDRIEDLVRKLDPAGAKKWGALREPEILRWYLAANPAMIPELAGQMDAAYVHELTHAAQRRRRGAGFLHDLKDGWINILNGMKYPIEREWEAFSAQDLYFHEKAMGDLSGLRFNAPDTMPAFQYSSYIASLADYRRVNAGQYAQDAARASKLRFRKAEAAYYAEALAREDRGWPRISVEGNILQARAQMEQGYPTLSLPFIETAHRRALQNRLSDSMAAEISEVFRSALSQIETSLAQAAAGRRPFFPPERDIALMKRLSAELGVPLPARAAAVAAAGAAPRFAARPL